MAQYRKKPVVIEAVRLTAETVQECYDFVDAKGNLPECGMGIDPADGQFKITTLEGVHTASVGDWIIKGVKGEFYPCKPDIFEQTYDAEITTFKERLIKEQEELENKFKDLAVSELKKVCEEQVINAQLLLEIAKKLEVTNEQFFIEWQDGLNKVSVS